MTQRHFEKLAARLAAVAPPNDVWRERGQWYECVAAVADVCAEVNQRFDRDKFYAAAGVK